MTPDLWPEVDRILGAVLELPAGERAAYIRATCAGRPLLAAEVEALLAHAHIEGPLDALGDSPDDALLAGHRVGPYRLVREIGRGGMGSVWLAERDDEQFDRRVAVKLLAAGLPVAESIRRFREERHILASLDHPHIARLLDAGRSDAGFHYLVMEYVEGVPITEFCAARKLGIRERVELLRTICSAVHFAHQRLVVHRDLKPDNILVTADGTPKLLDFGVAKMLTAIDAGAVATTSPMLRLFTPAYASPEQLDGRGVTTSSDVYALGVLSYELLTGTNPHLSGGSSLDDVFRAVREREPERPSAVASNRGDAKGAVLLAGDLDAIVLKASRKAADERYGSAEELADDLTRHLTRRPVIARRDTLKYRAQKFVARHRAAVAAAAVAFVLGIAGVSAVIWQANVARRERALAERRFNDVRQLAGTMIFSVDDQIESLPGSTAARQTLVNHASEYLGRLAQDAADDRGLALELATAYLRLGEVQGNPGRSNLGDSAGALKSYAGAKRILEKHLASDPNDLASKRLLARSHLLTCEVHLYLRKTDAALAAVQAGLAIRQDVAARTGLEADRKELAGAYYREADVIQANDEEASLVPRRKALEVFEAILRAHPERDEARRNVALAYKTMGQTMASLGRGEEERTFYLQALALDEQRVAANPLNATARLDLSFDTSQMATFLTNRGDLRGALGYIQRTVDARKSLLEADPRNARVRGRLAYAYLRSGSLRMGMREERAAIEDLKAALSLSEALIAANPADSIAQAYSAEALANIGYARQALARRATRAAERTAHRGEACAAFARASEAYRKNEQRGSSQPTERKDAADVAAQLALCRPKAASTH